MLFLDDILLKTDGFKELLKFAKENKAVSANGLSDIHKSVITATLSRSLKRKAVVISQDEAHAVQLSNDLEALGLTSVNFPQRDFNIGEVAGYSREYEHKRLDTLSALLGGAFDVLSVSVDAAIQYTVPKEILSKNIFALSVGETVSTNELAEKLLALGYSKSELCEGAGQFALRGGIFDIFPVNSSSPFRIEFWGDEIDSISVIDTETQRRTETVKSIKISPASEISDTAEKVAEKLNQYLKSNKKLTEKQRERIISDAELLSGGISISLDRYLNLVYEKPETVFDYLENPIIIVAESGNIAERFKSIGVINDADTESYLEKGFLSKKTAKLSLTEAEFLKRTENAVYLESFPRGNYENAVYGVIPFNFKRLPAWNGDIKILLEDLSYNLSNGGSAVIMSGEERAAKLLAEQLSENKVNAVFSPDGRIIPNGVCVICGGLSCGLEIPDKKFMLISNRYIAPEVKRRKQKHNKGKELGSIEELKIGDYVVHELHGIGIFDGIKRISNEGVVKDYIKIKYHGTDTLYVPVAQLNLVSKYIGAATENGAVKLNKLGGSEWQRTRGRVRKAVKDMAKQLTELYAKRMSIKGYAFSPDTDLQADFERKFQYDETDDQLRCTNEIKKDMQREVPMDRLLCGDVGFGKTEVALRAAFKCVSEGKQCAILVPTTILAMQHYNTVINRFGDLPINVGMLSRFVTPKNQQKVIAGLKSGRVDLVVGTHRLISKDIAFKNIGLVIIDEEQRFGVAQKERLNELYPFVDVLTLSATPIPRTLNMAMSGLRDMSSIDEAPGDRQPVQSYVLEQDTGVITDAILKEIRRGGQVYYLHNRVDTISHCAAKLKKLMPDLNIGIAHGKMSEDELSDIWRSLLEHEIDVLVCTTIIETGVDVPNVNTLIIEDADRMGLSQLHQLRGRVGRSPRKAYAYFCFNRGKQLSDVATKRLEAIREYTEFGSGFKIAMRDLEIRGAGSILGGEQHGNMEAVGYDMYLKLLSDAINEQNGVTNEPKKACTVDLNISAHIPESYIKSLPARLGVYKRISDIENDEDVTDVIDELCDRFGEPPKAVQGLIDIMTLRNKASAAEIYEITGTANSAILHLNSINTEIAAKLSGAFGNRFLLKAGNKPTFVIRLDKGQTMVDLVKELAKSL